MLQSYRNNEVREIAKILASIEGESTSVASKMMLSMKFEDQIFKSAGSLDDYKKKISKRLKKLQKTYAQQKAAGGGDAAAKATQESSADEQQREELLMKLRQTYGDLVLYVIKNAPAAMSDIERKLGSEKIEQFKPHIESCQEWAQELGIWKSDVIKKDEPEEGDKGDSEEEKPSASKPQIDKKKEEFQMPSLPQLQRLEQHLEKRAKNIRDYVVKHADPDLFLLETMERKDQDVSANKRATKLLAVNLSKRIQYIQQQQQGGVSSSQNQSQQPPLPNADPNSTPLQALENALDKAQATVPPATRNDGNQLQASLRHLDKMRAASTALMNYWTLGGDRIATAPPRTLKRIHDVMTESMGFITNAMKEKSLKSENGESSVTLQDAWTRRMELRTPIILEEDPNVATSSPPKRLRTSSYKPYIKARLLFHPNRKVPNNLLLAVRRKGARLVRPSTAKGNVNASHLVLEFGKAFTMTIYLSPLTVNIRAMAPSSDESEVSKGFNMNPYIDYPSVEGDTSAPWQPLSYGLAMTIATENSASDGSTVPRVLSVWGVSSTYDSIGHVVEERLRDASTRATTLLRKCFQNHVKDKTVDFEVESLEGGALMEFSNLARETYMRGWQD